MKAIILCAGYAVRLYPLTLNTPKALLEVSRKPVLNYILEKIEEISKVDEILVVTNARFYENFKQWKEKYQNCFSKEIYLVNDLTESNETRLGGIGDLDFTISQEKIHEDVLIVLGDNLFDCSLREISNFFESKKETIIGVHDIKDLEQAKRFGVLEVKENKVISMQEKPAEPKSSLISTGIYFIPKEDLHFVKEYINTGLPRDGPGNLFSYLSQKKQILAYEIKGRWYDIGTPETYKEVNEFWSKQK